MTWLGNVADIASAVTALLAVTAGVAVLITTRRLTTAMPVLLDLLLAAGVLRLAADPTYQRAATAAAIVAVRRLYTWAVSDHDRHDRSPGRHPVRRQRLPGLDRFLRDAVRRPAWRVGSDR